ncbi:hypothetical protein DP939_43090 [Spongiactinospora rosea]|uniref:Putative Flp pilus-assembly TadG-like N-terminal domain-containing protein n=1 Tax=Spongiactinospora rosea TaxID=2248750 RepID=A0A366LKL0_9ACTN|nr:pilus assembly protein TadG-related protein [Spongiactinospora rosea]RBQ13969.1 hypothetical protein DP939_43090 [Spongiactinospora rosea]
MRPSGIGEKGSITLFVAVFAFALLVCAGLVVDGGAKIQAYREAYAVAEEAARAGAGQVSLDHAYRHGGRLQIDRAKAMAGVQAYLRSVGHSGDASMPAGGAVQVSVTVSRPTVLLSMIGIGEVTATATATAALLQGIDQGEQ